MVEGFSPADPSRAGLFLDFDGTLAPIVANPADSAMTPDLAPVLSDLAERLGLLAVVSGRPAAFLAARAGVRGVRLLGLYGLQEYVDGTVRARPEAAAWEAAVDDARDLLAARLAGLRGVTLEDKGLAVAVHWRNAADRGSAGRAVERLVRDVAAATGLAREPGKLVEELRPPVAWDKGAGVSALTRELGLETVAYVGDDRGDLAAFAAVRRLGGLAVAVDAGDETPAEVLEAADLLLHGTEGVAVWLTDLRDALA